MVKLKKNGKVHLQARAFCGETRVNNHQYKFNKPIIYIMKPVILKVLPNH